MEPTKKSSFIKILILIVIIGIPASVIAYLYTISNKNTPDQNTATLPRNIPMVPIVLSVAMSLLLAQKPSRSPSP